jgi:hypothetical protein
MVLRGSDLLKGANSKKLLLLELWECWKPGGFSIFPRLIVKSNCIPRLK